MQQSSNSFKKLGLELGGNAPFIVFQDADLDLAVDAAIASKFKSSGQTCVCSNRIYVQKGIYTEFIQRLKNAVIQFRVGNGFDEKTIHGLLIHSAAVERVAGLVDDAVKWRAKVEIGGKRRAELGKSSPWRIGQGPKRIISADEASLAIKERTFLNPPSSLVSFQLCGW